MRIRWPNLIALLLLIIFLVFIKNHLAELLVVGLIGVCMVIGAQKGPTPGP